MQRSFSGFLAFGVGFLPAVVFGAGAFSVPGPVPASVVRVVDGDTLLVRARIWVRQDVETLVRILGIDAPEAGKRARCPEEEKLGELAVSAMKHLVRGGSLNLYDVRPDKYGGRVLARVENGEGQDVGKALLDGHYVRPYGGDARGTWCRAP